MSLHTIAAHNVHSSWVTRPEFLVLTHQVTGVRTGRLYIPASYLADNSDRFITWLNQSHIEFNESDLKRYDDGSIRLYFRSTESEYARCAKYYPKQQHWALGKEVA